MAKTILLETRTSSFLELLGNGRQFKVPPFQRDYSWSEEQWEDLWNDILALRSSSDDRHYMGALVVEPVSDREFLIIDGQQRLATLSVIALVVINYLRKLAAAGTDPKANEERASALRNRFIGEKDPASLLESSKLLLNETDNAFYQDYLVQLREPLNPRGLPKSNRALWDCFRWFSDHIGRDDALAASGAGLAALLSETTARQLLFILITVDDELNAYTVFETLNARGLELSSTDLLKNYLFSRIKVVADFEALQRRWRALIATVKQERFPEFLRYHLLCEHPKIRSQRLFKLVRDKVQSPQQVFDLLTALEARAELFAAAGDAGHEYWIDHGACRPYVRELILFKSRQMMPLLFAAWEKFSKEDFARILKLVSTVAFRYSVVSGLNTNALEPVYHQAAKNVLNGTASSVATVFEILRPIYVADEKFIADFATIDIDTSGQGRRLARYVLFKLESDASNVARDYESDPGTIEHILPENPSQVWEATISSSDWAKYAYRIGNLTPFEAARNRAVGNATFAEKRVQYTQSQYRLTIRIPEDYAEDWTAASIEARQRRMADRAAHIWRSDYVQS
jgi:hypothetical protein